MLKVWNMALIFATFELCLLGTFLTRSGVISSVHAFAQSSIGTWFMTFILLTLAVCSFSSSRTARISSPNTSWNRWSRANPVSCQQSSLARGLLHHPLGHVLSIILNLFRDTSHRRSSFLHRVAVPVALLLMLLTAVGPLLAWRKTSVESLKRNFLLPAIGSVAVGVMMIVLGVRPWKILRTSTRSWPPFSRRW